MEAKMNGIQTVQIEDTYETISFFDWLMMKIALSDEKKAKERIRKKTKQAVKKLW